MIVSRMKYYEASAGLVIQAKLTPFKQEVKDWI